MKRAFCLLSVVLFPAVIDFCDTSTSVSRRVRFQNGTDNYILLLSAQDPGERLTALHKLMEIYIAMDEQDEEQISGYKMKIAFAVLDAYWKEKDAFILDEIYKYLGQVILSPEASSLYIRRELQDEVLSVYFDASAIGNEQVLNRAEAILKDKKFLTIAVLMDKIFFESEFYSSAGEFLTRINGFSMSRKLSEIMLALDDMMGFEGWWDMVIEEKGFEQERESLFTLGVLMLYREIKAILEDEESMVLAPQEIPEFKEALRGLIMDELDDDQFEILRNFTIAALEVAWDYELKMREQRETNFGLAVGYYVRDSDTYEYIKLLFNILGFREITPSSSIKRFLMPLQSSVDSVIVMFEGVEGLNIINNHAVVNFVFQSPVGNQKIRDYLGWYLAGIASPLHILRTYPFTLGTLEDKQVVYFLPLREEYISHISSALPVLIEYSSDGIERLLKGIFSQFSVTREEVEQFLKERNFERIISDQAKEFFLQILDLLPWEDGVLSLDKVLDIPCVGEREPLTQEASNRIMAGMLVMETIKARYRREHGSFAQELISALGL